ncbi:MAG: CRISPR-associated protein Cas5 [Nanoarchaeota archaeon]
MIIKIEAETFHTRDPLTVTSPNSTIIPNLTALYGLLASILGIGANNVEKNRELLKNFASKLSIEEIYLEKLPYKFNFGINRIQGDLSKYRKGNIRTTINYQILKDLILYLKIKGNEEIIKDLKKLIKEKKSKFTPYLGTSEHLIKNIEIIEKEEFEKIKNNLITVVPIEEVKELNNKNIYVTNLVIDFDLTTKPFAILL